MRGVDARSSIPIRTRRRSCSLGSRARTAVARSGRGTNAVPRCSASQTSSLRSRSSSRRSWSKRRVRCSAPDRSVTSAGEVVRSAFVVRSSSRSQCASASACAIERVSRVAHAHRAAGVASWHGSGSCADPPGRPDGARSSDIPWIDRSSGGRKIGTEDGANPLGRAVRR